MPQSSDHDPTPPEPSSDVSRGGQASEGTVEIVHSGVPKGSRIVELSTILLDGARETVHSELTWKLISKIVSHAEEERQDLRSERDSARADTERWRTQAEQLARDISDLRARWESVSTLTNAQAFLYVVGGVLAGPAVRDALADHWIPQTIMVAILGAASIIAAVVLGKIGPRRKI